MGEITSGDRRLATADLQQRAARAATGLASIGIGEGDIIALFLRNDEPGDDLELLEIAARHGMSFDPGRTFRADHGSSPLALRICFSNARAHDLDEGARRLARAWDDYRRQRDRLRPARGTNAARRRS